MPADYFNYLPENRRCAAWGCTATALGRTRIPAGSAYPPQRHPDAHHFTWESGRILECFQVVYISSGCGTFESARTLGPQPVAAGSVLVLFPGVWHRYAPDPEVGWVEQWLEYRSPAFDAAVASDELRPDQPIREASADLVRLFNQAHAWAEGGGALARQTLISALGLQLLALLLADPAANQADPDAALVQRAMLHILENCHRPLNLQQLTAELQVGATRFRALFQTHAHTSPKSYHLRIRLERARELLLNTNKPLKEIAALLGFHSGFHFSNQFRAAHGESPRAWRERQRRATLNGLGTAKERQTRPCRHH